MSQEIKFNSEIAKRIGVSSAIVLSKLNDETRLLGEKKEDGKYYVRFSIPSIAAELDFYNERTVRRSIEELTRSNLIEINEFCSGKFICINYYGISELLNDN